MHAVAAAVRTWRRIDFDLTSDLSTQAIGPVLFLATLMLYPGHCREVPEYCGHETVAPPVPQLGEKSRKQGAKLRQVLVVFR